MAAKKTEQAAEANSIGDLSEIQKQIAEMLAEAKAEAARIVAEAKESLNVPSDDSEKAALKAKSIAEGEELVEIKLFKDGGKYKDDVFVSVNGETVAIQRGVKVKLKKKFVEVLENSSVQDEKTAALIEQRSGDWDKAAAKLS